MGIAQITTYSIYNAPPYILGEFLGTTLISILSSNDTQFNALETAEWALATQMFLATAVGVQLDVIGVELNFARNGQTDTQYRASLYLQASLNFSLGTPENLISVLRDVLGCTNIAIGFYYPAKVWIQQTSVYTPAALRAILINYLCSGVGLGLQQYIVDNNGNQIVDNNGNLLMGTTWS